MKNKEAKLVEKFRSLSIPVIGEAAAQTAVEKTLGLEDLSDVLALTNVLAG